MKQRKLPCELCGRVVQIRTRIKNGEYRGKKACPLCAKKHRESRTVNSPSNTEKSERGMFFERLLRKFRGGTTCWECGLLIRNPRTHNFAHILPKSKYSSVETENQNILHLCTTTDRNDGDEGCHEKFDCCKEKRQKMKVYRMAKRMLSLIKHKIQERGKEYFEYFKN